MALVAEFYWYEKCDISLALKREGDGELLGAIFWGKHWFSETVTNQRELCVMCKYLGVY
jgi:hypothetical protein